jgi:hypothetical protein
MVQILIDSYSGVSSLQQLTSVQYSPLLGDIVRVLAKGFLSKNEYNRMTTAQNILDVMTS